MADFKSDLTPSSNYVVWGTESTTTLHMLATEIRVLKRAAKFALESRDLKVCEQALVDAHFLIGCYRKRAEIVQQFAPTT